MGALALGTHGFIRQHIQGSPAPGKGARCQESTAEKMHQPLEPPMIWQAHVPQPVRLTITMETFLSTSSSSLPAVPAAPPAPEAFPSWLAFPFSVLDFSSLNQPLGIKPSTTHRHGSTSLLGNAVTRGSPVTVFPIVPGAGETSSPGSCTTFPSQLY